MGERKTKRKVRVQRYLEELYMVRVMTHDVWSRGCCQTRAFLLPGESGQPKVRCYASVNGWSTRLCAERTRPSHLQPTPIRSATSEVLCRLLLTLTCSHSVSAYPFNVSPEAAQNLLSPFASTLLRKKLFQSILCWFFPDAGFEPIRPVRLQPVYFPGWILDVELQGQVTIKGHDVRP